MALELPFGISLTNPKANIDEQYGPYESIEAALEAVPSSIRAIGKTVGVMVDDTLKEFWWKDGITDEDLILKVDEQVQSDWEQNDDTQPDYIKNRTHYEATVEFVDMDTPNKGDHPFDWQSVPVGGEEYKVTYVQNGNTYTENVTATQSGAVVTLSVTGGNIITYNPNASPNGNINSKNKYTHFTVIQEGVHKLNEKFIPDTIARRGDNTSNFVNDGDGNSPFVTKDEIAQPDWNQNDPEAPDHVKNRTHWEEEATIQEAKHIDETNYDDQQEITGTLANLYENIQLTPELIVGATITFNGVEYQLTEENRTNSPIFGGNETKWYFGKYPLFGDDVDIFVAQICQESPSDEIMIQWYSDDVTFEGSSISGKIIMVSTYEGDEREYSWDLPALDGIEYHKLNKGYVDTDWNENNDESVSHIKNRTHWKERVVVDARELNLENYDELDENNNYALYKNVKLVESALLGSTITAHYMEEGEPVEETITLTNENRVLNADDEGVWYFGTLYDYCIITGQVSPAEIEQYGFTDMFKSSYLYFDRGNNMWSDNILGYAMLNARISNMPEPNTFLQYYEDSDNYEERTLNAVDEYKYHKIDPNYLPENIQADWNQNDDTQIDYVKNRTHYEYEDVVYPEIGAIAVNGYYRIADCLDTLRGCKLQFTNKFNQRVEDWEFNYDRNRWSPISSETLITPIYYYHNESYEWAERSSSKYILNVQYETTIDGNTFEPGLYVLNDNTYKIGVYLTKVKKLDPKFLPELTSTPDWNQNDPEASDFIKNRTHYIIQAEETEIIMDEESIGGDVEETLIGGGPYSVTGFGEYMPSEDDLGKKYRVTVTDEENFVLADNIITQAVKIYAPVYGIPWSGPAVFSEQVVIPILGDVSLEEPTGLAAAFTEENGLIIINTPDYDAYSRQPFTVTLKEITQEEEVEKLDSKFLPDDVVYKDDIKQADWNQNDPEVDDYVKNRTHYRDLNKYFLTMGETVYDDEQGDYFTNVNRFISSPEGLYFELPDGEYVYTYEYAGDHFHEVDYYEGEVDWEGDLEIIHDEDGNIIIQYDGGYKYFLIITNPNETFTTTGLYMPNWIWDPNEDPIYPEYVVGEVSYKRLDPNYLPENIQSDWGQNDDTQIDYIKNRTHYEYVDGATYPAAGDTPVNGYYRIGDCLDSLKNYGLQCDMSGDIIEWKYSEENGYWYAYGSLFKGEVNYNDEDTYETASMFSNNYILNVKEQAEIDGDVFESGLYILDSSTMFGIYIPKVKKLDPKFLPEITVPTKTSDLINDGEGGSPADPFVVESELAPVATSNDYNDLDNKPTIPVQPTKTSDLINDGEGGSPVDPFMKQGDLTITQSADPETVILHYNKTVITANGQTTTIEVPQMDSALSPSSENPVMNRVLDAALKTKLNASRFEELEQTAAVAHFVGSPAVLDSLVIKTGEVLEPEDEITGMYYPAELTSGGRAYNQWEMREARSTTYFKVYDVSQYEVVHLKCSERAGRILTNTDPTWFKNRIQTYDRKFYVYDESEGAAGTNSEQAYMQPRNPGTYYDLDITTNGKHYLYVYEGNSSQSVVVTYGGGITQVPTSLLYNDGEGGSPADPFAKMSDVNGALPTRTSDLINDGEGGSPADPFVSHLDMTPSQSDWDYIMGNS